MTDYIKRDDAIRIARLQGKHAQFDGMAQDVAPVRHGQWESFEDVFLDTCYECSECGLAFYLADGGTPQENQYNYCPNCGAKMGEEKNNE